MEESYKTIFEEAEFSFEVKKSKFIGRICPCETKEEAEEFFARVKSLHKQATHNVPAFCLRHQDMKWSSDDHEPQGTAGAPILKAIEGEGLRDVAIVVTRYFGGTLLGTGGLVKAYTDSAVGAIKSAKIKTMVYCSFLELKARYQDYGKLSYILPSYTHKVLEDEFSDVVRLRIAIDHRELERFSKELIDGFSARISITEEKQDYFCFS